MARLRRLCGTSPAYTGRHPCRDPRSAGRGVRERFLTEAAIATGQRVAEFGWHRVLLAGDKPVADGFTDRLPDSVRERVIGVVTLTCYGRSRRPSLIVSRTRWMRPGVETLTG